MIDYKNSTKIMRGLIKEIKKKQVLLTCGDKETISYLIRKLAPFKQEELNKLWEAYH